MNKLLFIVAVAFLLTGCDEIATKVLPPQVKEELVKMCASTYKSQAACEADQACKWSVDKCGPK